MGLYPSPTNDAFVPGKSSPSNLLVLLLAYHIFSLSLSLYLYLLLAMVAPLFYFCKVVRGTCYTQLLEYYTFFLLFERGMIECPYFYFSFPFFFFIILFYGDFLFFIIDKKSKSININKRKKNKKKKLK